jgi:hypothetical protein
MCRVVACLSQDTRRAYLPYSFQKKTQKNSSFCINIVGESSDLGSQYEGAYVDAVYCCEAWELTVWAQQLGVKIYPQGVTLIDQLYTAFPREIRDMIWIHLYELEANATENLDLALYSSVLGLPGEKIDDGFLEP